MKIMLLIPHLSDGGGERVLSELSQAFGADCVVVVFERKFSYPVAEKVVCIEAPIGGSHGPLRLLGTLTRLARLRQVLSAEQPDAVISFMGEANLINALLSANPILTVHNHLSSTYGLRRGLSRIIPNMLTRFLYPRATVVTVSEAVKDDLVERFGVLSSSVSVIPNPVDCEKLRAMASEPVQSGWKQGEPVIITAGRLVREKGQWHILRAFAEVRKRVPCKLAMLGSGELEPYLRELAEGLGVMEHTYFLGWVSNPFGYFARSDVFVQASLTEGFGLAMLEAMTCGLPVIAADCPGGTREILSPRSGERYGLLIPPLDGVFREASEPCVASERKLAGAILRVLTEPDLKEDLKRAGRTRSEGFSYEAFVAAYRNLLANVVSRRA